MTKVRSLLILMSDGVPRTKLEIAAALSMPLLEAAYTIQTALNNRGMRSATPPPVYSITPAGHDLLQRTPMQKQELARRRNARRRLVAARKAAELLPAKEKAAKEKLRKQREAQHLEREERRAEFLAEAEGIVSRAKAGKVANSVFNWR